MQNNSSLSRLPLERLAGSQTIGDKEKISEISRQFESILVKQIIQEAQKPVFKSDYMPTGVASGIYQDMISTQLADDISRSGNLGLAKHLQLQLSRLTPEGATGVEKNSKP